MRCHRRSLMLASLALGLVASSCQERGGVTERHPTQGAVGTAMQRMESTVTAAMDPRGLEASRIGGESVLPAVRIDGAGLGAHALVQDDAIHEHVSAQRAGDGWTVSWNDANHTRAFMAQLDPSGQPTGAPVLLRESRSDEEDVLAPSVAFNGSDFGLVWVDPANGRVRFERVARDGQALGRSTLVHDGLEMPQASRIVWSGNEYGVAIAVNSGVYFARVSREGSRMGGGVMVVDDSAVGGLDDFTASSDGFQIGWHGQGESSSVHHEARVTRGGQLVGSSTRLGARFAAR